MGASGVKRPSLYETGDYIKVELPDDSTGIGEWMWVRVESCDRKRQIVIGTLDNGSVHCHEGKLKLGCGLAVSFSQIREHKKPSEFTVQ